MMNEQKILEIARGIEWPSYSHVGNEHVIEFVNAILAAQAESVELNTARLNAIVNGFCVWQVINLETGVEQWHCQYAIDGIVCGDTLREAIDKGIEANEKI